ncbi:hypothetical protein Asi03nite_41680 [Actinoplanes siamensis]|uniref:Uncharacterized protein n=1 Tax=Actinoplanes siamensis TaxID=1223317 RepID=A0A919N9A4_9ACTN|nr:hypothetical protein Asi03nite_41680 [Actinoplanes siamensis]
MALGALRALGGGLLTPAAGHGAVDGLGVLFSSRVAETPDQWGGTQSGAG